MRVKGFDSPEAAAMLKGLRLLMPASERPALDSDEEFYVQELIGMQVGCACCTLLLKSYESLHAHMCPMLFTQCLQGQ